MKYPLRSLFPDAAFAGALFALLLGCYARTLQPTLGGNTYDSEEFQHVAYTLGIAHPTGYPLYLLLGKLWLTLLPLGSVAYRMNLLSAVLTAAAAAAFYFLLRALGRRAPVAAPCALFLGLSLPIWRHALSASVGPLNLLLIALTLYALLLWRAGKVSLTLPAFLFGLALAHHRSALVLIPAALLLALVAPGPRRWARVVAALLTPLLLYLYIPLRGNSSPWYTNDLASFIRMVGGGDSGQYILSSPEQLLESYARFAQSFGQWLGLAGLGLLLAGLAAALWQAMHQARDRVVDLALLLATLAYTALGLVYGGEVDRYYAPALLLFVIWMARGADAAVDLLERVIGRARWQALAPAAAGLGLVAWAGLTGLGNLPQVDLNQNDRVYRLWNEIMNLPLERGAVIIGNWSELNAMRYMQSVEGRRPDLFADYADPTEASVAETLKRNMAAGRAIYLTPGDPNPHLDYSYSAVGPLIRVNATRDAKLPPLPVRLGQTLGPLSLLGYGLSISMEPGPLREAVEVEPGRQSARLALYWRVIEQPGADYKVRLRLLDKAGHSVWQATVSPLRGLYPATRWQPGETVTDAQGVQIPPGTPPGRFTVELALVDPQSGRPVAEAARLTGISVGRAAASQADKLFVRTRRTVDFGDLRLLGFSGGGSPVRAGQPLNFALGWMARNELSEDYQLRVQLRSGGSKAWAEMTAPLVHSLPTAQWKQGEAFKEYYSLPLPADAPPGTYSLVLSVLDRAGRPVATSPDGQAETALFEVTRAE